MKKPLLFAITAVFAASPVFALTPPPLPPEESATFILKGRIAAINVADLTFTINGVPIRLDSHVQIVPPSPPFPDPLVVGPPSIIPVLPPLPPFRPVPPFPPELSVGVFVEARGFIERGTLIANVVSVFLVPPIHPPIPPPIVTPRPPIVTPIPTPFPLPIVPPVEPRLPEHPGIFPPPLTPEERARILQNIQEQINEITRRIGEMLRGRLQPAPPPGGGGIFPPVQQLPF